MYTVTTDVQTVAQVIVTLATLADEENLQFSAEEVRELYLKNKLSKVTTIGICFYQGIRMDALYAITGRKFLNQESTEQWHRTFDAAVRQIYGN